LLRLLLNVGAQLVAVLLLDLLFGLVHSAIELCNETVSLPCSIALSSWVLSCLGIPRSWSGISILTAQGNSRLPAELSTQIFAFNANAPTLFFAPITGYLCYGPWVRRKCRQATRLGGRHGFNLLVPLEICRCQVPRDGNNWPLRWRMALRQDCCCDCRRMSSGRAFTWRRTRSRISVVFCWAALVTGTRSGTPFTRGQAGYDVVNGLRATF
jgi:hypothetical protein